MIASTQIANTETLFAFIAVLVFKLLNRKVQRNYEIILENHFVSTTKRAENTANILNCYFRAKFTTSPIKLNTYMLEIKFASQKHIYLAFSVL